MLLYVFIFFFVVFLFSSRRRHTRSLRDWSSDVCSSDLALAALAEPIRLGPHEVIVTGSAGVAVWPDDGIDGEDLFSRADAAMYRAKSRGRNRTEHSDPMIDAGAARRRELGVDLWHALRRDELFLLFQP